MGHSPLLPIPQTGYIVRGLAVPCTPAAFRGQRAPETLVMIHTIAILYITDTGFMNAGRQATLFARWIDVL